VKAWRLATGAEERAWPAHRGEVYAVACSPDGGRCATAGKAPAILLWAGDAAVPAARR